MGIIYNEFAKYGIIIKYKQVLFCHLFYNSHANQLILTNYQKKRIFKKYSYKSI